MCVGQVARFLIAFANYLELGDALFGQLWTQRRWHLELPSEVTLLRPEQTPGRNNQAPKKVEDV